MYVFPEEIIGLSSSWKEEPTSIYIKLVQRVRERDRLKVNRNDVIFKGFSLNQEHYMDAFYFPLIQHYNGDSHHLF